MTTPLPEPFLPPEVDLRDFPYMPMHAARLFSSEFHARATDAEWRAGVTLWLKAFFMPAAALPDDDVQLARLAEFGRDVKSWLKVRAIALHGWVKCSDGRLHHPVVAEMAHGAWLRKAAYDTARQKDRERLSKWRDAKRAKHERDTDETHDGTQRETPDETRFETSNKGREGNGIEGNKDRGERAPVGTRLPADWGLPDDWRGLAEAKRAEHGLPAINLDLEAEIFRNHWHGQAGAKGRKADWRKTWVNWCLSPLAGRGGPGRVVALPSKEQIEKSIATARW